MATPYDPELDNIEESDYVINAPEIRGLYFVSKGGDGMWYVTKQSNFYTFNPEQVEIDMNFGSSDEAIQWVEKTRCL